jgi:hypothetical protein
LKKRADAGRLRKEIDEMMKSKQALASQQMQAKKGVDVITREWWEIRRMEIM